MKKLILLTIPGIGCLTEAMAQDTYWAMLGNKRLNTQTNKVISNRTNDLPFEMYGYAWQYPRGMFDKTGRCLFHFDQRMQKP